MASGNHFVTQSLLQDDNEPNDTAQAYFDSFIDEHKRITPMTQFLIIPDELGKIVVNAIKNITVDPPTLDSSGLKMTVVPIHLLTFHHGREKFRMELLQMHSCKKMLHLQ